MAIRAWRLFVSAEIWLRVFEMPKAEISGWPKFEIILSAALVGNLEEVDETQENDEKLQLARAQAKEFSAPYRDARKMLRLKMKFLCQLKK